MVQAVSRRPFTAVAMVHFQASPCEIREKKVMEKGVSTSTSVSSIIVYLPTLLIHPFIIDAV
jgi:hypothetical protein